METNLAYIQNVKAKLKFPVQIVIIHVRRSLFLGSQAGRRELQKLLTGSEGEKNGITNGVNSAEALVSGSNTERPVERCPTGS